MKTRKVAALLAAELVVAALAAGALWSARPAERRICAGFLPENNMKIPVGAVHADGVVEARFNRVLDQAQSVYGPIVAQRGAKLVIDRKWKDPTVNAYAMQQGKVWKIAMFGGLARHPAVTEEGFALVACHELGHHLGGHPKIGGDEWATNEGGSDYFATLKCARLLLPMKRLDVDPLVAKSCLEARGRGSRENCEHAAMAGLSLATLLSELGGTGPLSFATPDPTVVDAMMDAHPPAQCRLDTYFQGALCPRPVKPEQSASDATAGACTAKAGDVFGLRPRCWYLPPADEPVPGQPAPAVVDRLESARRTLQTFTAAFSGRGT